MKPLVYIACPLGAETVVEMIQNRERAKRWLRWAIINWPGVSPIAPWITTTEILDDHQDVHRSLGMEINKSVLACCEQLWAFVRLSKGMAQEVAWMKEQGKQSLQFFNLGPEPEDGYYGPGVLL